jgi:uncharacterized membrane protein
MTKVSPSSKKSIIILDIAKAYAVIMMILGHTLWQYLDLQSQFLDTFIGEIWMNLRYYTAPIFLFSSGILYSKFQSKSSNKKKLININNLFLLAYGMHLPFFGGTWEEFYKVDILHLFGILFLLNLFIYKLNRKFLLFILISLVTSNQFFDFTISSPKLIASYFDNNSYFPINEYANHFWIGCLVGFVPNIFKVAELNIKPLNLSLLFLSRNSLKLYVSHLLILYGGNTLIGVNSFFGVNSLNFSQSILLFLVVFALSIIMVLTFNMIRNYLYPKALR